MSSVSPDLTTGSRVIHAELGTGIFIGPEPGGYARVFFQSHGERQVAIGSIIRSLTWDEEVISNIRPATSDAVKRLWLAIEAEELPLLENATALTAAKVDLLPHQIVLTHKIATASPRRFLIADSVGLGKTIETALVLRELASRGELSRALMVVPAGLVNNWRRELNDTFHLDFEVFGSEGDVTDRKTNAFAKHNRLIASIDTLKRPTRLKKILEAPRWDLIVFDEAHHLTAYQAGNKVTKTQNFKLAEALRDHSRDLLLLSATPHQGDHFRFWMLIRLLNSALFLSTDDMLHNRYRLNSVVFRRTQADACDAQGEALFSRRQVHTQTFRLSQSEGVFYGALMEYLRDGYNLAEAKGSKGRALGFVMTIFQKIAASSFSAVGSTLRRRLLSLTIHEAIVCDQSLDVDSRERALSDARNLLHDMHDLPTDMLPVQRVASGRRASLMSANSPPLQN
jgi:SNF2 family DNA or RNA helicase